MKILNLNIFKKTGLLIYIFVYLIFSNLAMAQSRKFDAVKNLENAFNNGDFRYIQDYLKGKESYTYSRKFKKLINEFPNLKWKINKLITNSDENIYAINVFGEKKINDEKYVFESNFNYLFSVNNNKIDEGRIKNLLTIIRSDEKKIDISFNIPNEVLTGTKYDLDIILNKPLGDTIVAGGLKSYQDQSLLEEDIILEPLESGGIFKTTRAPSSEATQIWSGVIVHPDGIISFTKSVEIVEKI